MTCKSCIDSSVGAKQVSTPASWISIMYVNILYSLQLARLQYKNCAKCNQKITRSAKIATKQLTAAIAARLCSLSIAR